MLFFDEFGGSAGTVGVGGDDEVDTSSGLGQLLACEVEVIHAGDGLVVRQFVDRSLTVHSDVEGVEFHRLTGCGYQFDAVNEDVIRHVACSGYIEGQ